MASMVLFKDPALRLRSAEFKWRSGWAKDLGIRAFCLLRADEVDHDNARRGPSDLNDVGGAWKQLNRLKISTLEERMGPDTNGRLETDLLFRAGYGCCFSLRN